MRNVIESPVLTVKFPMPSDLRRSEKTSSAASTTAFPAGGTGIVKVIARVATVGEGSGTQPATANVISSSPKPSLRTWLRPSR